MFSRSARRVLKKAIRRAFAASAPYRIEDPDFEGVPLESRGALRGYLEGAGFVSGEGAILPSGFALAELSFFRRYPVVVLASLLVLFFTASSAFEIWFTKRLVQEGSALPFDGPGCEDEDDYAEDGFESPI